MLSLTTHSVNFSYSTACPYWLTKNTQEHTHMHILIYVVIWIVVVQSHIACNSSQTHGLQHAWISCPLPGFPVPSPFPGVCSNSRPLSQCCHPTISSFVGPSSSCLQSFPKWSEIAQSCPTLCNPMDSSPPGYSVHGIFQARILEWVAISFSRGSSQPRDQAWVSCIADRRFTIWASREATSFPKSESFSMSRLFASGGQSIGASALASVSIQGRFPLGLTALISLQYKGLKSFHQHHSPKASIF